jgi:hypothetical protein
VNESGYESAVPRLRSLAEGLQWKLPVTGLTENLHALAQRVSRVKPYRAAIEPAGS